MIEFLATAFDEFPLLSISQGGTKKLARLRERSPQSGG